MALVEVEIIAQVITARYGTLASGDILKTDQAFADHLVNDCKGAKWPEPKVEAGIGRTAVEPPAEEIQPAALSTLPVASLSTDVIAGLETPGFAALDSAAVDGMSNVQIRALTTDQVVALTSAGANALTTTPVSSLGNAALVQEAVVEQPPAIAAVPISLSKPAAKPAKKSPK